MTSTELAGMPVVGDAEDVLVCFHMTSAAAAEKIEWSRHMLAGSEGFVGAGIYFALTPENTYRKATQRGLLLKCVVNVGKQLIVSKKMRDLTRGVVEALGATSVRVAEGVLSSGPEIVVYDPHRVASIQRMKLEGDSWVEDGAVHVLVDNGIAFPSPSPFPPADPALRRRSCRHHITGPCLYCELEERTRIGHVGGGGGGGGGRRGRGGEGGEGEPGSGEWGEGGGEGEREREGEAEPPRTAAPPSKPPTGPARPGGYPPGRPGDCRPS